MNYLFMYGTDISSLKDKATKGEASALHVYTSIKLNLPAPILQDHRDVTKCEISSFNQGDPFFLQYLKT